MKKTITFFPTQAAKMLLATLLLTLTAQTARAAEYEISTLEQLRAFMETVHFEDYAGDVIRLTADIDCKRGRFNTGDPEYPSTFCGTFDGQGHKIYNFVNTPTGDSQEGYGAAMFDFAETGATIKDLTLEGTLPGTCSGAYSAAFVLAVDTSLGLTLDNCHFNGSVTNVYHSAALVGFASPGADIEMPSITLINCSANANITTTRNYIAGGLVAKGTGVQAYNCSFKGKVTSLGTVGGLIGVAINCNLENCFEGGYTYIDENSNNVYSTDYTVLDNTMTTIPAGWYVVNSDVTFNGDLSTNADGEVHIILCDGATLTANNIVPIGASDYLRIYGQSQGTGTANISGSIEASSSLHIYGGTINVTGNIMCQQSGVVIYGGNVTAADINGHEGSLYLAGGTITASSLTVNQGDIKLGGATVKANSYHVTQGNVTILTGITYYDGTGAIYTEGNLSAEQISDISGRTLRTYDYRTVNYVAADGTTATADARPLDNTMTTLDAGWYVVNSDVNVNGRIDLTGNTNLILADGYTLDVKGIYIPLGKTLTIYAQSDGVTAGKIVSHPSDGAAIGGKPGNDNGNIVIYGGSIEATGAVHCAGIGSNDGQTGGTITIYGGNINASGSYGIGAGENGDDVAITLGWMKATDQIYASSYSGTVTIVDGQAFINDASTPEIVSGTDIDKALVDGKTLKPHWTGSGDSESDPYMINRPGELDLLAQRVNAGTSNSGKFFKLGADIAFSHTTEWNNAESTENNYTAIGGFFNRNGYPFRGTFDGQGHTVSGIRIYRDGNDDVDENLGLFGLVLSGTVKNVTVSDMRITGYSGVGGIVGENNEYSRVENCHATATVALNAVQDEADSFGGIVGYSLMNSAIIGCSSYVTITTSGTLTDCKDFGGIVGSTDNECSVKNCLAVGVAIPNISFTHDQNDITASGAIAGCFSGDALSHNYYSGCTLGGTLKESGIGAGRDDNGNSNSNERHDVTDNNGAVPTTLHTLTLGEDITASGVLINQSGTISVASGSTVVLSYSGSLGANQIAVFSLGGTALSGNSFTMPAADATVSVSTVTVWGIAEGADGSEGNPYVITRCAELDLLSQRVNAGTDYSGKYFVLANDIAYDPNCIDANGENYTAIGISSHSFKGIFDGQGHTISGIRIYKGGQTPNVDGNQGLFGYVNNGTVRNVTLADASITGYDNIGGIAGNSSYGTIENCLVIGTSIRATHNINGSGGAIVGNNSSGTTLSHNYYSDCIRNISSSGIGTKNGDYSINDGAVRAIILSETEAVPSMNENDKVVFRRKFTQGVASTVCLPFSMTSITGGKVYQFVGVEYDNTDGWVATMQEADPTAEPPVTGNEATALAANTPYLFMPAATGPVLFYGTAPASVSAGSTTSTDWTFYGTYSRLTYETTESNSNPFSGKVFGFAAYATEAGANNNASQEAVEAGEFVRATTGAYIPAFRAFLKYAGSEESLQARGTRSRKTVVPEYITVRLIGKNGDVDAIGEISLSTGEVTFDPNVWYDLSGRELAEKPTQRGIYINGNKKVVLH